MESVGSFFILYVSTMMSLLVSHLPKVVGTPGPRVLALFAAPQHP